jgi:integrase
MSKQNPFLYRRGDVLAFRIAVPLELRPFIGCRELTKSLRTSDKYLAVPIALELAAIAKRLFYDLRAIMSDNASDNASKLKKLEQEVFMRKELRKVEKREALLEAKTPQALAIQKLKSELFDELRDKYQQTPNTSPIVTPKPLDNASGETSTVSKLNPTKKHRLSDSIQKWILFNKPASTSIRAFKFAISRFENLYPDLYVETTEKKHIAGFVQHLANENKSAKTINKEHGMIRAMFSFAESEGWVTDNPARGTKLPKIKKSQIREYEIDEVKTIFNSPLFTKQWRPKTTSEYKGMGEAVYWVPLLLLFTGARLDEICQLTSDRVCMKDGVNVVIIDTILEGGNLKTEESKRTVPIHNSLIKLGFLEYAARIKTKSNGMLFPLLKKNEDGNYGANLGRWWGKYLRGEIGIIDKNISPSHSFRHLFITECRRLGFREDFDYAITGHTSGRVDVHSGYGSYPIKALSENINKIDYSGLDLSHLPQKQAM